jgi:hypothetical protein
MDQSPSMQMEPAIGAARPFRFWIEFGTDEAQLALDAVFTGIGGESRSLEGGALHGLHDGPCTQALLAGSFVLQAMVSRSPILSRMQQLEMNPCNRSRRRPRK